MGVCRVVKHDPAVDDVVAQVEAVVDTVTGQDLYRWYDVRRVCWCHERC